MTIDAAAARTLRRIAATMLPLVALQVAAYTLAPAAAPLVPPEANDPAAILLADDATSSTPDVVVVGDSRAGADADLTAIRREVRSLAGMTVGEQTIWYPGEEPALEGLVVRHLLALRHPPRVLMLSVSEFAFNANYDMDPSADIWQVAPPDGAAAWNDAVARDRHPERLPAGYLIPLFTRDRVVAEVVRCAIGQLLRPRCYPDTFGGKMAPFTEQLVLEAYSKVLKDYRIDARQIAALRSIGETCATRGVQVVMYVPPVYRIDGLIAAQYPDFLEAVRAAADASGATFLDYHDLLRERADFADPSHLSHVGAAALAPYLAVDIARALNAPR